MDCGFLTNEATPVVQVQDEKVLKGSGGRLGVGAAI